MDREARRQLRLQIAEPPAPPRRERVQRQPTLDEVVAEVMRRIPRPQPGKAGKDAVVTREMVMAAVSEYMLAFPPSRGKPGKDGVGLAQARFEKVGDDTNLILTRDDGSEIDVGALPKQKGGSSSLGLMRLRQHAVTAGVLFGHGDPAALLGMDLQTYLDIDTGKLWKKNSTTWELQFTISSGSSSWGGITGTLSDQTDLQTALDGIAVYLDGTLGFGADPGANEAEVIVAAPGCLATSRAQAFVQVGATASNSIDDHKTLGALGSFICEPQVDQIVVTCKVDGGFYVQGDFNIEVVWS